MFYEILQMQYEFIYETIQEALTCGDTGILVTNLRQGFLDLQQPVKKGKGKSGLEHQFEVQILQSELRFKDT